MLDTDSGVARPRFSAVDMRQEHAAACRVPYQHIKTLVVGKGEYHVRYKGMASNSGEGLPFVPYVFDLL